ncbi:MAG: alpha/beta hydrolase [Frankiales bacterium]|nr:alpha/beta hydrolase [Frankiales bacterium]
MKALTKVGVLPTADRLVKQPVAKRIAMGPAKGMVGSLPTGVATRDVDVQTEDGRSVRVRNYTPDTATAGATGVAYLHGGGWIVGGIASCDHLCQRIAADASAVVLSIEYSLAPEHRFPVALHEGLAVLDWMREHADDLGIDSARLVVGGDSAGGNLAAVLALMSRDRGTPLAGQLLIYPSVDHTWSTPSSCNYSGPGLSVDEARAVSRYYIGEADPADPLISPLVSADVTGLPPALVVAAAFDCLHDEAVAYAERLLAAGVPCRLLDYPDYAHGFFSVPRFYPGVEAAWEELATFVRSLETESAR